jgi:hypothetical protein
MSQYILFSNLHQDLFVEATFLIRELYDLELLVARAKPENCHLASF